MLHNKIYHEFTTLRAEIREQVNETLKSSETFQKVGNFINLANDNSELLAEKISFNNSLCYKGITDIRCSFNKESLITAGYEIHISVYKEKEYIRSVNIGIDNLIILLAECDLIED